MATPLKQSTAVTIRMGPFLDKTDGVTEETALGLASTDVQLSKAGGAFANKNDATARARARPERVVLLCPERHGHGHARLPASESGRRRDSSARMA